MEDDDDTLAASIREETTGGGEQEEGGESEQEETQEGTEGEGESEEESTGEEEGEAEEAEASGPGEEEETEEEDEDTGERTQSRGRNRVQKLAEERNRLRAENEELRRRASGGQHNGGGQAAPIQQTPQQVRDGIKANVTKLMDGFEFLSPADRAERMMQAQEKVLQRVMQPLQFSAADTQDQTRFSRQYGNNPLYKRLSAKVEEQVTQARSQGQFIPREIIFMNLVGQDAVRQIVKGGGKQRRAAEGRKAVAAGVSTKGKGDTGGKGTKSRIQALEERLSNVKI